MDRTLIDVRFVLSMTKTGTIAYGINPHVSRDLNEPVHAGAILFTSSLDRHSLM
jgi:hypothetical protein